MWQPGRLLLEPAHVVSGGEVVSVCRRAAVGLQTAFKGDTFHQLAGDRTLQLGCLHRLDLSSTACDFNRSFDIPQHPFGDVRVNRIGCDEDIVVIGGGNFYPAFRSASGYGIE